MTLDELQTKLDRLRSETSMPDKNIPVTICDLSDDSDENFNFRQLKDVEVVTIGKREIIALYFES